MELYLGTIVIWPLPWQPISFLICMGQTMPIQQNTALFALIGTTYGGDGVQTFKLPDFRGRVPVGTGGAAIGTVNANLGQTVGALTANGTGILNTSVSGALSGANATGSVTLSASQLPAHTHSTPQQSVSVQIPVSTSNAATNTVASPAGGNTVLGIGFATAASFSGAAKIYTTAAASDNLNPFPLNIPANNTGSAGTGSPVPITLPVSGNVNIALTNINVPVTNVSTVQPSLGINFLICVEGIFPSRQ